VSVKGIDIYNVYLPPKEKTESETVRAIVKIQGKKNEIVIGDFNRAFMWNRGSHYRPTLDQWAKGI